MKMRRTSERHDGNEELVMRRWVMTRWREVMGNEKLAIKR